MVQPKHEPRALWAFDETPEARRRRARTVLGRLDRTYPDAKTALDFQTPLQLLIATILSAQSTDKKINEISPALFARYRSAADFATSPPGQLEQDIRQSGFFNQKARNIRAACHVLLDRFDGDVPQTMEELLLLPGVARKTANVVLGNAFGISVGIAVDTHVHRLSRRFAFSDQQDPVKVEQDLMALFPRASWFKVSHLLIAHGRAICDAKRPRCDACPVERWCPASQLARAVPATAVPSASSATRQPARTRSAHTSRTPRTD